MKEFTVILATCKNKNGQHTAIGYQNRLPWAGIDVGDLSHFRITTTGPRETARDPVSTHTETTQVVENVIIMGRKTYESIGSKPLPNRLNVVISSSCGQVQPFISNNIISPVAVCGAASPQPLFFKTLEDSLWYLEQSQNVGQCFVIGGARLYDEAIKHRKCQQIIHTRIEGDYPYDTQISCDISSHPEMELTKITGKIYYYIRRKYPKTGEDKYLELLTEILKNGYPIEDRTKVGTCALFGKSLTYNITCINPQETDPVKHQYRVPMFTTKKMYAKGVIGELLWFLSGSTNVKYLQDNNIRIWDGNSSKEFLASRGLPYDEGEIGPGYGYQWTNWNGEGINQIQNIIDQLKTDPRDRRMVLNAWNVSDLPKMALPPCHIMYIFDTTGDVLNCSVTIRSNDMFLGHPFNVLSAAILVIMLSKIVHMTPGQIMINITNAHIYRNHLDQVETQISREVFAPPLLQITKPITSFDNMKNLEIADFIITNYTSHEPIKGQMAV